MQVNVLIKKPIIGKNRTLLISNVKEILFHKDVALLRCIVGNMNEEVIYPIGRIVSISE